MYSYSVGNSYTSGQRNIGETFMKFDLPAFPNGVTVSSAILCAYMNKETTVNEKTYIGVTEVKAYWDATVGITAANNSLGPLDSLFTLATAELDNITDIRKKKFDLTTVVKKWVEYNEVQFGIKLYHYNVVGNATNDQVTLLSENYAVQTSQRPYLEIDYRVNVGLEDYWSYDSIDVGRAGVGYINKYNNNLTFVHNDVALAGLMPITLNHIYNDAFVSSNYDVAGLYSNMKFGLGWKINYQQAVLPVADYNGLNLQSRYTHVYIDADGTEHYFAKVYVLGVGYKYYDEDGLGYTLTFDTSNSNQYYQIMDTNKNILKFRSDGRLWRIEDNNGNYNEMHYDASFRIVKITDNEGRSIKLEYTDTNFFRKVLYDESSSEVYQKEMNTSYHGSQLYKFCYNDGKITDYVYENGTTGKMTGIYNFDGYTVYLSNTVREIDDYTTVGVRTIQEKMTTIADPAVGPIGSTVTVNGTAQKKELMFYRGKSVTVVPRTNVAFQEFGSTTYADNIFYTETYDTFGRKVSEYAYIYNDFVATSYFYDGMGIPKVDLDFLTIQASDVVSRLNKNKQTTSSYYSSTSINYLDNGSFEDNDESWTIYNTSASRVECGVSAGDSLFGAHSYKISVFQPYGSYIRNSQTITLAPGSYTFSGYVKLLDQNTAQVTTEGICDLPMVIQLSTASE